MEITDRSMNLNKARGNQDNKDDKLQHRTDQGYAIINTMQSKN